MSSDSDQQRAEDRYRPHLDGLRAVAVYLVVAFHAGSDRFVGGYVGVDVFFVLSGFLVTQVLLRDLDAVGSISFRRFYARRFRRLLPAAFVALVVTAVVFSALASPVEVAEAEPGFRAAFLYVANWHFVAEAADYFGADIEANPVLHFWSLAVEEQFYLLWPLVLGGLFAVGRRARSRQRDVVRFVVVVGALASVGWAWSLKDSDPNRAYYGTDARAYQLMAGALLALSPGAVARLRPHGRIARVAGVFGLVALVGVATSWIHLDAIERGIATTVVTAGLLVSLEAADGGWGQRVLSRAPVVYLGKISYGTYLWHWPVIVVMTRSFDLSPLSTVALTTLIATALASLSYQLMEHPIRRSPVLDRFRSPVIAAGLTISVVSALVIIPTVTDRSDGGSTAAATPGTSTVGFTPVPDLDYETISGQITLITNCYDEPVTACTEVEGSGPHILILGDSHAAMMVPTFKRIARDEDLTLSVATRGGCPWQLDLYVPPLAVSGNTVDPEDCRVQRADVYERVIPELDPDIIVVMNLGYETPGQMVQYLGEDQELVRPGSPEQEELLRSTTTAAIERLEAGGRKVVILEPIPLDREFTNAVACLSDADVVEQCRYVVDDAPTWLERLYRTIDERDDQLWSVDLDRSVCPFLPICDPIVDGLVTKMDGSHLHAPFARSLAGPVTALLEDNGVLPA